MLLCKIGRAALVIVQEIVQEKALKFRTGGTPVRSKPYTKPFLSPTLYHCIYYVTTYRKKRVVYGILSTVSLRAATVFIVILKRVHLGILLLGIL